MTESKIGTKIKSYCSVCRGIRNCEVRGYHAEHGGDDFSDWHRDWYLLTCCGCEHVFAQSVSTHSEDYHQEYNSQNEVINVYEETIDTWPAKAKRDRPPWFVFGRVETNLEGTLRLNGALSELYGALDHDLNLLASIGVRTSFDIAAELLGIDANLPFMSKITKLIDRGLIRESEKDHFDILVDAGSASAHRGWRPQVGDLDPLMDTLEEFIFNNMIQPARKRAAAEKIAKVKAKVPPKPSRDSKRKDTLGESNLAATNLGEQVREESPTAD